MRIQYIVTQEEVTSVKAKLREIKQGALVARDAGDTDTSRELYLKAKGFEDALRMLGIIKDKQ